MARFSAWGLLLAGCVTASTPEPSAPALAAIANAGSAPAAEEHCAEQHGEPEVTPFERTDVAYTLPAVTLKDQTGASVSLDALLETDRPVALNFIFATCTTICPVMSATFAQTRLVLGDDASQVSFVSLTIDPEHDTPEVLAEYAERFEASEGWRFVTGASEDVEQVLRAFDAWKGSKFSHEPITLLRPSGGAEWVRLEGLGSGAALAAEVRALLTPSTP